MCAIFAAIEFVGFKRGAFDKRELDWQRLHLHQERED